MSIPSRRYYANSAPQLTLSSNLNSTSTSMSVSGSFAGYPTSFPYFDVLEAGTANMEIVRVDSVLGTTATIVRGQDGTIAVSHPAGATVDQAVIRQDFDEANLHTSSTSGVHGITGSVVGTTDTQTLTNKTISGGTITGSIAAAGATLASPSISGTLGGTGAISVSGNISGAVITGTGAVSGASFTASSNGALAGVLVPKSYSNEAAATTAIGSPPTGAVVLLTTPTNGPAGLYEFNSSNWQALGPVRQIYQARQTGTTSIPNAAFTNVPMDVLDFDNSSWLITSGGLTLPSGQGGIFLVSGSVFWAVNATGRRAGQLAVNGTKVNGSEVLLPATASGSAIVSLPSVFVTLAAGQSLTLQAFQDSGSALSTVAGSALVVMRVG